MARGGADDQIPTARVTAAYRRIDEVDRPEVWITLRDQAEVLADAEAVEDRLAAGDELPLAGLVVGVKDNIDVAGLATTAACPQFAYTAHTTAAAVARLTAAGAVILGKTNLDQFATGFTGTRSPYGAVRNARHPDVIPGGSSSGSAVAVALGIADIGIGTDTLGSGRVPAACNGIVGIKLSRGAIPTHGVVPACADLDTVTVFAGRVGLGARAAAVMSGPDPRDPRSHPWPADVALAAPAAPRLAVADDATVAGLPAEHRDAFAQTAAAAKAAGCTVEPVDVTTLLDEAGRIDDAAMVAERYAAVGEFLATEPAGADPAVAETIGAARDITGAGFAAGLHALAHARAAAAELFGRFDALLLPTTPKPPTLSQVRADPIGTDRPMGAYTSFCNLFDLPAVAIPGAPTTTGAPFGVMIVGATHAEQVGIRHRRPPRRGGAATIGRPRGRAGRVRSPTPRADRARAARRAARQTPRPGPGRRKTPTHRAGQAWPRRAVPRLRRRARTVRRRVAAPVVGGRDRTRRRPPRSRVHRRRELTACAQDREVARRRPPS